MKYTISKDLLKDLEDLKEGEISVISPANYNTILYKTELSDLTDDRIEVGLKFIIRNTYLNEVLVIDDEIVIDLDLLQSDVRGITGYFQVVHTLDIFIRTKAKVKSQIMAKTHLNALGVYYDSEVNKIYHVMNLVVLDDDKADFINMFNSKNKLWEKIVDLISSPNVGKFDKMILSKLRIINN